MIELLDIFGNDNMVVDVARVSYKKQADQFSKEENDKLIKYLYTNEHWSPFSHPVIQFRVQCPIYVERQLFKHKVGVSINSVSGRYVTFEDSYSKINVWRKQSESSKQGSEGLIDDQEKANQIQDYVIRKCQQSYKDLLELGVSKEQARSILPLNLNTEFVMTASLYAMMRIFKQRLHKHCQQETKALVLNMFLTLKTTNKFPTTLGLIADNLFRG